MNQKSKIIEFYSPFLIGHAFPLAKLAEIIQVKFPEYKIIFITFELIRSRLEKEFPTISFKGIRADFTAEVEKEMVVLPPH